MIKHISVHAVNEMLDAGDECQVIDVREFSEFNSERIADAQLVPLSDFERHAEGIDHSRPVYLVCRSGNRARQAAEKLMRGGFTDVHVVHGGMAAWSNAALPVIKDESNTWALERQVRFAAGLSVVAGIALGFLFTPYVFLLSALVGLGLLFSAVTDTCGMALMLARMPWNKGPVSCDRSPSAEQADQIGA